MIINKRFDFLLRDRGSSENKRKRLLNENELKSFKEHCVSIGKKKGNQLLHVPRIDDEDGYNSRVNMSRTSGPSTLVEIPKGVISMTAGEKAIYDKVVAVEHNLRELEKTVSALGTQVNSLNNANSGIHGNDEVNEFLRSLPLSNEEELASFEESLLAEDKVNFLVNCLYLCGGETPHKAVFQQMKKLLSKNVSSLYSGQGKKRGKLPFKELRCHGVILRAVRKRFPEATDIEIQRAISLYLVGAKDRDGGRNNR